MKYAKSTAMTIEKGLKQKNEHNQQYPTISYLMAQIFVSKRSSIHLHKLESSV